MNGLPPAVSADLTANGLRDYWRARIWQAVMDSYAGVQMSKFPEDLRVYEHLLWLQSPDAVIEVGTDAGGSALWFRDRLRTLRSYGRTADDPLVVTIDVDQAAARANLAAVDPDYGREIRMVEGDVRDPGTVAAVREHVAGRPAFVVEDSAHVYDTTQASLQAFSDLVPISGFFVVEDGCVDVEELRILEDWPRGVLPALRDWLATDAGGRFVVRRDLELYGVSCHPSGFLQRVA
ncbi:MAG: CmcI family methyltransferase [Thermoleophilia bacterium]